MLIRPLPRSQVVTLVLSLLAACGSTQGGLTAKPDSGDPDLIGAKPDALRLDELGAMLDGSASDAAMSHPDGNKSDTIVLPPDAGASDTSISPPDGRTLDSGTSLSDGGVPSNSVVRACILAASCGAPGPNISVSQCLAEFGRTASRRDDTMLNHLLACAGANSCAEFHSCWGGDLVMLSAYMVDAECVGNTISAELVEGVTPAHFDCGAIGGQCVGLSSGALRVGCNVGACGGPDPVASCDGVTASGCGGWGEYTRVDCARSGRICTSDGRYAMCAGSGAACDESERVACAGSVATYCANGARATIDCATTMFATGCAAGAISSEPCTAAGRGCDAYSFVGRCDGSVFELCVDGSIVSFDCRNIGFPRCDLPSVGAARCRDDT